MKIKFGITFKNMEIENGPFKGYFNFNTNFSSGPSIVYDRNQPFMKWDADNKIKGFNRTLFPFIGAAYYIPKSPEIDQMDLRRYLYALETDQVPSSGNTERFHIELKKIAVPDDYIPRLTPCPYPWCRGIKTTNSFKIPLFSGRGPGHLVKKVLIIFFALLVLVLIIYFAML